MFLHLRLKFPIIAMCDDLQATSGMSNVIPVNVKGTLPDIESAKCICYSNASILDPLVDISCMKQTPHETPLLHDYDYFASIFHSPVLEGRKG